MSDMKRNVPYCALIIYIDFYIMTIHKREIEWRGKDV